MNAKAEPANARFDAVLWSVVATLIAAGVGANHYFAEISIVYRFVALVALAVLAGFLALRTTQGRSFWALAKEARVEIRKVVWPTRQETSQTTLIVVAVVLVSGLLLWALDSLLGWLASKVIA